MKKTICAASLLMLLSGAAFSQTIYKCGKVLQQTPCDGEGTGAITVKPATVAAKSPVSSASNETVKKKSFGDTLAEERVQREAWHARKRAEEAYASKLEACRREQAAIESEMQYSNNNLAGATRDVSIAQKMEAAARVCSAEAESLARKLDAARARCKDVNCDAAKIFEHRK